MHVRIIYHNCKLMRTENNFVQEEELNATGMETAVRLLLYEMHIQHSSSPIKSLSSHHPVRFTKGKVGQSLKDSLGYCALFPFNSRPSNAIILVIIHHYTSMATSGDQYVFLSSHQLVVFGFCKTRWIVSVGRTGIQP